MRIFCIDACIGGIGTLSLVKSHLVSREGIENASFGMLGDERARDSRSRMLLMSYIKRGTILQRVTRIRIDERFGCSTGTGFESRRRFESSIARGRTRASH